MLSWLTIPLYAVRMGMEAQNAAALGFFRLAGANIPSSESNGAKIPSSESNIEGGAIRTTAPVLASTAARSGAKKRRASAHSTPKKRRQSLKGRHRR
jgi:hypothetical protein